MTTAFLLDTSFLITLVDDRRPRHDVARKYFEQALANGAVMFVSSLALAEFARKQAVTDLPLSALRVLPFNIDHAIASGGLASAMMPLRDPDDERATVLTDLKLIAQADCERIPHILTEDRRTLAKYVDRARTEGVSQCRAVVLADGFDSCWFNDGQTTLPLT
ncbi:MAG: PIN domain-containing protein [Xanthomonadales bacterium]|nr:PIN domain-containing protein [Xanthomonadales bacterium]